MYLFSRRARLSGAKLRESMGWAVEITNRVQQTTGLQLRLFSSSFSPAVGTLVWGTFVADLATLEAANDKLAVDDGFAELSERGTQYTIPGALDDALVVIVHGQPDPNRQIEYSVSVRTTVTPGNIATGTALGIEIAQRAEAITGAPTLFGLDATGNYGGVMWLTGFSNIAELERGEMAVNADASFIELIDTKAKGVYAAAPGDAIQRVLRRIPT